jgi:hypothetical protein
MTSAPQSILLIWEDLRLYPGMKASTQYQTSTGQYQNTQALYFVYTTSAKLTGYQQEYSVKRVTITKELHSIMR